MAVVEEHRMQRLHLITKLELPLSPTNLLFLEPSRDTNAVDLLVGMTKTRTASGPSLRVESVLSLVRLEKNFGNQIGARLLCELTDTHSRASIVSMHQQIDYLREASMTSYKSRLLILTWDTLLNIFDMRDAAELSKDLKMMRQKQQSELCRSRMTTVEHSSPR